MRRRLPSITSLRAFEAVARHLSFSRAADELSLTQSAVSRQVAALEAMMNLKLVNRLPHRLLLTDAGLVYSGEVRETLERLAAATLRAMASRSGLAPWTLRSPRRSPPDGWCRGCITSTSPTPASPCS